MIGKKFVLLCLALTCVVPGSSVVAQADYPARTVTLIVPYPAGSTDTSARMLAERLSQVWGQAVVVENRPGGSGVIGMMAGRSATPDGYTLLLAMSGPLAGNPNLMSKLPYDPLKDYSYVAGIISIPLMLVANPGSPYNSIGELVDAAKKAPGAISVGSGGNGTTNHMALELFKSRAKIDLLHVPYRGSGAGLADVVGGHIPLFVMSISESAPNIKAGKLKAIAVTGPRRAPQMPDVPTVAESGYSGYEGVGWGGIAAPLGTPRLVLQKVESDIKRVMSDPAFVDRVLAAGLVPDFRDGAAFREYIRTETDKWGKVVREARIKID